MTFTCDALKTIAASKIRRDILDALDSPMRLCELRRKVGANAPNTSARAKELERLGLVKRVNGDFELTSAGRLIRSYLFLLKGSMDSLHKNYGFWEKMIDRLPPEIVSRLHEFENAELIKSEKDDLDRVKDEIISTIKRAEDYLVLHLPNRSSCILSAIEGLPDNIGKEVVTLEEDPNLSYGMVKTSTKTILFSEMLDIGLVKQG